MKSALKSGIQTYQILTNYDEVCIPSLSSILLAVFEKLFGVYLESQLCIFFQKLKLCFLSKKQPKFITIYFIETERNYNRAC